jgi:uncharacterized membrane protein (UPF0127 family)
MRSRAVLTLRREDGRVVCDAVTVADTMGRRLRGLLGKRSLRSGEGLMLRPAWSIHTAFMRFPIDVVFLDHDQVVLRIERELRPFHTASCRGAREVVELAAGECDRRGLREGDRVTWAPRLAYDEGLSAENAVVRPGERVAGTVVLATTDQRFAKLVRFLLDTRQIDLLATVAPDRLRSSLEERPDVIVLDAGDRLAQTLRIANHARARRPRSTILIAGESVTERAPAGIRIFHKWDETEGLIAAVENALGMGTVAPLPEPPMLRSG